MNLNEFELDLVKRDAAGSSSARALRLQNNVPAIVYGAGQEPISSHIEYDVLQRALNSRTLFNKFTYLKIGKEKKLAFARVVQKHPVTEKVLHIDFQMVEKSDVVKMRIPVSFINKELCEAIKLGGLLNTVLSHIELHGVVSSMPDALIVDLKDAKVGVSIKVEDLQLPAGVKVGTKYQGKVVATILAAKKKGGDAEASAEAAAA